MRLANALTGRGQADRRESIKDKVADFTWP
jgi:hypothetical protein